MMKQHGGEGKGKYKGKKSNMMMKQHGGEGKDMGMSKGSGMSKGMEGKGYCGPGRYLSGESY